MLEFAEVWFLLLFTCYFQLEKAYDTIMMSQLTKRKKGETFGSFRVC